MQEGITLRQRRKALAAAAFAGGLVLLTGFALLVYYGPNPHKVSRHARTEWSKEFHEVGLASVPRDARYGGGPSIDGASSSWTFKADAPTVERWLSDSRSILTAEVKTKPGKQAYLTSVPSANKVSLVVVKTRGERCFVEVEIIDLVTTNVEADSQECALKDAHEVLHEALEDNVVWSYML